jgi:hypothetical protein
MSMLYPDCTGAHAHEACDYISAIGTKLQCGNKSILHPILNVVQWPASALAVVLPLGAQTGIFQILQLQL